MRMKGIEIARGFYDITSAARAIARTRLVLPRAENESKVRYRFIHIHSHMPHSTLSHLFEDSEARDDDRGETQSRQ